MVSLPLEYYNIKNTPNQARNGVGSWRATKRCQPVFLFEHRRAGRRGQCIRYSTARQYRVVYGCPQLSAKLYAVLPTDLIGCSGG
jgi:hypothetical protein